MKKFVEDYLSEMMFGLTNDRVLELCNSNPDRPEINNVVCGLEEYCASCSDIDDNGFYYLSFIRNGKRELEGIILKLQLSTQEQNRITLYFAKYLTSLYPEYKLDLFDLANAYQSLRRSVFATKGFTVVDWDSDREKHGDELIMLAHQPINIKHFDKKYFYASIFDGTKSSDVKDDLSKKNRIYINYNNRTNLFKIGRSINPVKREKTLQGEDDAIRTIACWYAPKEVETELHEKFINQRERGEWFRLTYCHLEQVRDLMGKYVE